MQSSRNKVSVLYDPTHIQHNNQKCHEQADRVQTIVSVLANQNSVQIKAITNPADEQLILKVHSKKYLDKLYDLTKDLTQSLQVGSSYVCKDSVEVAKKSVQLGIEGVEMQMKGVTDYCYILNRPPGHHSSTSMDGPRGFCLFNNVAIAAQHLIDNHGLEKIVILDWDVHHGDGTQEIVYNNKKIYFISIHKFNRKQFYPCWEYSDMQYCSDGTNINIPLDNYKDNIQIKDADYIYLFIKIVLPIIQSIEPDYILISNGLDSLGQDPLGLFKLTPIAFNSCDLSTKLTESLYSLKEDTILQLVDVLQGEVVQYQHILPTETILKTVQKVIAIQQQYFKVLANKHPIDQQIQSDLQTHNYYKLADSQYLQILFQDQFFLKPQRSQQTAQFYQQFDPQDPFYQHLPCLHQSMKIKDTCYLRFDNVNKPGSIIIDIHLDQLFFQQNQKLKISYNLSEIQRVWREEVSIQEINCLINELVTDSKAVSQIVVFYKSFKGMIRRTRNWLLHNVSILLVYQNKQLDCWLVGLQEIENIKHSGDKALNEIINQLIELQPV